VKTAKLDLEDAEIFDEMRQFFGLVVPDVQILPPPMVVFVFNILELIMSSVNSGVTGPNFTKFSRGIHTSFVLLTCTARVELS